MAALLGLVLLVAVLGLLRWYSLADVKTIKRGLAWTGIGLLALVAVFLALTGRFGAALAALAGLSVWASRLGPSSGSPRRKAESWPAGNRPTGTGGPRWMWPARW